MSEMTTYSAPDAATGSVAGQILAKPREDFHVVFVRAPIVSTKGAVNNEATPPLALAFLGGYLKQKGYRVTIVDGIGLGLNRYWDWEKRAGFWCQGASFEDIRSAIPKDADLLAFTCMFSGEWPLNRDLIQFIRQHFPEVPTIAGGEHITALPEYSLRDCSALDFAALGEGEHLLFEFCERVRQKLPITLAGVHSLNENGEYQNSGDFPRIDEVDAIPWPNWDIAKLDPYWNAHKSYGISSYRDMPLMVSRGCPYKCTFCSNPKMWTTKYILREVDDVLDEIESYIKKYQITSLQFYDLTAITKKSWTLEFCRKMIERGINIKWSLPSGTRSEALDKEVLPLLAKTQCTYLVYAPESGSKTTLELIKKRVKLDVLNDSVREAKRLGMVLRSNLIIGFPHETRKLLFETIFYGWKLAFMGVDEVSINIFSPYPGSEIFDNIYAENKIRINDDYFYALTSLNSDYTKFNPLTFCKYIGPKELAFYRIFFMLSNYFISYVFFPRRIIRSLKNIFSGKEATTVFEHRFQDLLKRLFK